MCKSGWFLNPNESFLRPRLLACKGQWLLSQETLSSPKIGKNNHSKVSRACYKDARSLECISRAHAIADLFYPRKMCFSITPKPIPGLHVLFLLEPQSLISCVLGGSTRDLAKGLGKHSKTIYLCQEPWSLRWPDLFSMSKCFYSDMI